VNEIRMIHTPEEHTTALAEIEQLMKGDPPQGTPEGARLELLALIVEDYERRVFREESLTVDVRLGAGVLEILRETGKKCGESPGRVATILLTFCAVSAKSPGLLPPAEEGDDEEAQR
jgi:hypothetical protein